MMIRDSLDTDALSKTFVIIPGAQKGGTTTLFELLCKHSQISRPKIKESQFFTLNKEKIRSNLDWYQNLFSKQTSICIDASAHYLWTERTPGLIKEFIDNPKILIILRDPAKRTYSAFKSRELCYPPADLRSFDSILNSLEGQTIEEIIFSENRCLEQAIQNNKVSLDYLRLIKRRFPEFLKPSFKDAFLGHRYFQNSIYSVQVNRYKKIFGANVKTIFLEKLLLNFEETLKDVLDFIGIEFEEALSNLPHINKTKEPRNKIFKILINFLRTNPISKHSLKTMDSVGLSWLKELVDEKFNTATRISLEHYLQAREILREEYNYWSKRDKNIAHLWKYTIKRD